VTERGVRSAGDFGATQELSLASYRWSTASAAAKPDSSNRYVSAFREFSVFRGPPGSVP